MIYDNGGPVSLGKKDAAFTPWTKWWKHMRESVGMDVLTRCDSGDMVLVLVFFACWANQAVVFMKKQDQLTKALDSLLSSLNLCGSKKRAADEKNSEKSKRSRTS
jgi:hypothetical protein